MKPNPTACAAIMLAAVCATDLNAQQACTGTTSCTTTHSVSVTVGGLLSLSLSTASTGLTAPSAANIVSGANLVDPGPTLTISANQSWSVNIKSLNATEWTYTGTASGVKPIGQLAYSTSSGGPFTAITATDAPFAIGTAATVGATQASFFQTTWVAGFGAPSNAPGLYSLPISFTLTAP